MSLQNQLKMDFLNPVKAEVLLSVAFVLGV